MHIITRRALAAVIAIALAACSADTAKDEAAISDLLHAMFDRPDATLDASPIVVSGEYAIADWTQGEMGGRALLQRRERGWGVILCAGDGLRTASGLADLGVPAVDANALARDLATAERDTSQARLAVMSHFDGIVRMDR